MSDYDLMHDDTDKLTADQLRRHADRVVFRNEFAIAYEEPVEPLYEETNTSGERGYLTAWVTNDHTKSENPVYERKQGMSGDDSMVREKLSQMAKTDDVSTIELFISEEVEQ